MKKFAAAFLLLLLGLRFAGATVLMDDRVTVVTNTTYVVVTNNIGAVTVVQTNAFYVTNIVEGVVVNITNSFTASGVYQLRGLTGDVDLVVQPGWTAGVSNNGSTIYVTGGVPDGTPGVDQIAYWYGSSTSQKQWSALGAPPGTVGVSTNWAAISTVWPTTNTIIVAVSPFIIDLWGASASYSGAGGYTYAVCTLPVGTILDAVIGTPGSGNTNGLTASLALGPGGAGLTYVSIRGTTNIIASVGGCGGGYNPGFGSCAGGYYINANNGIGSATNASAGQGAWADNVYGVNAARGTNYTLGGSTECDGSWMQGGNASTNGCTTNATPVLGGGGAGYPYGGAGAVKNKNTGVSGVPGAGGGGGSGFVNTNYCSYGYTVRGSPAVGAVNVYAPNSDLPNYTPGRGLGSGASGAAGCIGTRGNGP
jgi:hypothetical protein